MAKPTGKNAGYLKEKEIEAKLNKLIVVDPDGRVRYPAGTDDLSVAEDLDTNEGAVMRMRRLLWPNRALVPQHWRSAMEEEPEVAAATPISPAAPPVIAGSVLREHIREDIELALARSWQMSTETMVDMMQDIRQIKVALLALTNTLTATTPQS